MLGCYAHCALIVLSLFVRLIALAQTNLAVGSTEFGAVRGPQLLHGNTQ